MAIIKKEDVVAWEDGSQIICADCGDPGEAKPLTKSGFEEDYIVICDSCGARIL